MAICMPQKDNRMMPYLISETGIDRVLGELARCGDQFAGDIKDYIVR